MSGYTTIINGVHCALLKDQHDAELAARRRPLTDDHMRPRTEDVAPNEQPSLIDTYLAELRRAIATDRAVSGGAK